MGKLGFGMMRLPLKIVERHPRDSFTIATKFPTFNLIPEDKIEATFQSQLVNLGVDYIDYYLIHDI